MQTEHLYQTLLKQSFQAKVAANPKYSLRGYAKSLDISASALSEIMSGKRGISVSKAMKLLENLDLTIEEKNNFINSVKSTKKSYQKVNYEDLSFKQINMDVFEFISEWYHYAILNLAQVEGTPFDSEYIAKRLGLTPVVAHRAVERLVGLNLIKNNNGLLERTGHSLKTTEDIPSFALKKYHSQILDKAKESLFESSVEDRDITTITMAIDPSKIKKAKEKIKKFRRSLMNFLEDGEQTEVYEMNIALFPVSKKDTTHEVLQ